jgi:hypothetical protein
VGNCLISFLGSTNTTNKPEALKHNFFVAEDILLRLRCTDIVGIKSISRVILSSDKNGFGLD